MKKATIFILSLLLIGGISYVAYGKFGIGLPSVIKKRVEKLDKKVRKAKEKKEEVYTQWVRVNGETSATISSKDSFTITANTASGIELYLYMDWDGDGQIDPEDCLGFMGAKCVLRIEDNSWMDEDLTLNEVQYTMSFPGFWIAGNLIIEVVNVEKHQTATVTLKVNHPTSDHGVKGQLRFKGSPILGTVIALRDSEDGFYLAATDPNGTYNLPLPQGNYLIFAFPYWAALEKAMENKVGTTTLLSISGIKTVDFDLPSYDTATISGKVTCGGQGVGGVVVDAKAVEDHHYYYFQATTDANGNYSLIVKDGSTYTVTFRPSYGYIGPTGKDISAGSSGINFEVEKGTCSVYGTVLKKSGSGILSAYVLPWPAGYGNAGCRTNKYGRYALFLSSGEWEIWALTQLTGRYAVYKYTAQTKTATLLPPPATVNIDFNLIEHNATITGTVFYSDGKTPCPFAFVNGWYDSGTGILDGGFYVSDNNGSYTLPAVAEWEYKITAEKYPAETETTTTAPATEVDLILPLPPP
jgi:hypothetical protein